MTAPVRAPVVRCVLLDRDDLALLLSAAERDAADRKDVVLGVVRFPLPGEERLLRRAVRRARALLADGGAP